MQGYFKIKFFTKVFFKKYMHAKYGNPLVFTNADYFGRIVSSLLEKNVVEKQSKGYIYKAFDKFDEPITFFLPVSWMKNYVYGTDIPADKVLFLNRLIEYRFEDELATYCNISRLLGISIKKAIENFCLNCNIEIDDDITMDNLLKIERACRKKMQKKSSPLYTAKPVQLTVV